MSRALGRAPRALVGLAALAIAQGCDPAEDPGVWDNGPTFLIVAPAVEQPSSPADGTAIFVQARGGSFVSIVTTGGKHRYTSLGQDAKSSCAELPGSEPLYLVVKPDDEECIVETRLYSDCDNLGDGGVGLGICGSHDAFVASTLLTVLSRVPRDGGRDADAGRDVDGARGADAARDIGAAQDSTDADAADTTSGEP